jgi:hypothetical protein
MTLAVLAVAAEMALVLGLTAAHIRARSAPRRQAERFRAAEETARRLAHHARIVDASIAELSELVVEQCLAEVGLGATSEPH